MRSKWLFIRFPRLALQWYVRAEQEAIALALYRAADHQLLQISDSAMACGVQAGMKHSTGLALCPTLRLVPWQSSYAQTALQTIAEHLYQQVAHIHLQGDDALVLEVGSMLRLHGGWAALCDRLQHELDSLGFDFCWARGTTPLAAQLLCDAGIATLTCSEQVLRERLQQLPLAAVELPERVQQTLLRMGWSTLQDLLRLPTSSLRRRFDAALLEWRARLTGELPDLRRWFVPEAHYDRSLELVHEIVDSQALRFPLRRMLAELTTWLRSSERLCQCLRLTLHHREQPSGTISVQLLETSQQADEFTRLLLLKLERWELPEAVIALTLQADSLPREQMNSGDLFNEVSGQQLSPAQWLGRLQARFDQGQLQGLTHIDDPRPEHAWRGISVEHLLSGNKNPAVEPRQDMIRPSWLLAIPERVSREQLQLCSGPERIACGWWDGDEVQRDYFIAEIGEQRAWVFRDDQARWFIHGWFG